MSKMLAKVAEIAKLYDTMQVENRGMIETYIMKLMYMREIMKDKFGKEWVLKGLVWIREREEEIERSIRRYYTINSVRIGTDIDQTITKTINEVLQWDGVSLPYKLYTIEKFNGLGYEKVKPKINSPYLWNGSNHYTRGKYVRDGVYDPNKMDKQCGVAVAYKVVEMYGIM
jgi:hypothetical protein